MLDSGAYTIELAMRFPAHPDAEYEHHADAQKARGYEIEKVKGGIIKRMARLRHF